MTVSRRLVVCVSVRVHRGLGLAVLLPGLGVMDSVTVARRLSVYVLVPVGVLVGGLAVGSPEAVGPVAV